MTRSMVKRGERVRLQMMGRSEQVQELMKSKERQLGMTLHSL